MMLSKIKQEMCCSILIDFKPGGKWKVGHLLFLNILFGVFVYTLIFMLCVCLRWEKLLHPQSRASDPVSLEL